nr:hypothetical protein HK105_001250 [Polyrhizophydium stewartii]
MHRHAAIHPALVEAFRSAPGTAAPGAALAAALADAADRRDVISMSSPMSGAASATLGTVPDLPAPASPFVVPARIATPPAAFGPLAPAAMHADGHAPRSSAAAAPAAPLYSSQFVLAFAADAQPAGGAAHSDHGDELVSAASPALDASGFLVDPALGASAFSTLGASTIASMIQQQQQQHPRPATPGRREQHPHGSAPSVGGLVGSTTPRFGPTSAASEIFVRGNPAQQGDGLAGFVLMDRSSSRGSFKSIHSSGDLGESPILVPMPATVMHSLLAGSFHNDGPPPFALEPPQARPIQSAAVEPAFVGVPTTQPMPPPPPAAQITAQGQTAGHATGKTKESVSHMHESEPRGSSERMIHGHSKLSEEMRSDLDKGMDDFVVFSVDAYWPKNLALDLFAPGDDGSWSWIVLKIIGAIVAAGMGGYIAFKVTATLHRMFTDRVARTVLLI